MVTKADPDALPLSAAAQAGTASTADPAITQTARTMLPMRINVVCQHQSDTMASPTTRRDCWGYDDRLGVSLSDVKHIVILMQENRSFDHQYHAVPGDNPQSPERSLVLVGVPNHPIGGLL